MGVDYANEPSLDLPERPSEAACWAACDAIHDILSAHPEDQAYVIAQYLDAFAKRCVGDLNATIHPPKPGRVYGGD